MQGPQAGAEEDVNGRPAEGLRVWKKEKVCGEAGGRSAKPGEKKPARGLLTGRSLRPAAVCLRPGRSPPKARGPACVLGPGLWRRPRGAASWVLPLGRLPGPGPLSVLGSLLEQHPPGQKRGEWVTPRLSGVKPEDSTFWLLLPGSGPKCEAIKGAWWLVSQLPPSGAGKNSLRRVLWEPLPLALQWPTRQTCDELSCPLQEPEVQPGGTPVSETSATLHPQHPPQPSSSRSPRHAPKGPSERG